MSFQLWLSLSLLQRVTYRLYPGLAIQKHQRYFGEAPQFSSTTFGDDRDCFLLILNLKVRLLYCPSIKMKFSLAILIAFGMRPWQRCNRSRLFMRERAREASSLVTLLLNAPTIYLGTKDLSRPDVAARDGPFIYLVDSRAHPRNPWCQPPLVLIPRRRGPSCGP